MHICSKQKPMAPIDSNILFPHSYITLQMRYLMTVHSNWTPPSLSCGMNHSSELPSPVAADKHWQLIRTESVYSFIGVMIGTWHHLNTALSPFLMIQSVLLNQEIQYQKRVKWIWVRTKMISRFHVRKSKDNLQASAFELQVDISRR